MAAVGFGAKFEAFEGNLKTKQLKGFDNYVQCFAVRRFSKIIVRFCEAMNSSELQDKFLSV